MTTRLPMMISGNIVRLLLLNYLLLLLLLPTTLAQQPSNSTTTTTTLSNPILQEHVDRFFAILNGEEEMYNETEYAERFTPFFVDEAPLQGFVPIVEQLQNTSRSWQVVDILDESMPNSAFLLFRPTDTPNNDPLLLLTISVDAETNQISQMLISSGEPPQLENPPQTMSEAVQQLQATGHNFNYLVTDILEDDGGKGQQCSVLAQQGLNVPAPMGSMFKFWVLAAVVDAVDNGTVSWDQLVYITEEDKSLPSGIVQNDPVGSNRTVRELAELMISISDNTATDLLLKLVGRVAVEQAQVAYGHSNATLNIPFLNTKELFILKLDGAPGNGRPGPLGEQYLAAGTESAQRSILADLVNVTIASYDLNISAWAGGPIAIEELEWFGTPMDLCNVLVKLYQNEEARRIMAINPGIADTQHLWQYIGYKGGSEPGAFGMAWYLIPNTTTATTTDTARHRVVTGQLWNTTSEIDETQTALLMGALRDLSLTADFSTTDGDETTVEPEEDQDEEDEEEEEEPVGEEDPEEDLTSSAVSKLLLPAIVPSVLLLFLGRLCQSL